MSRRTYRRRPWRAVAYVPDATAPHGRRRVVAGRASACTEDGLARFRLEHRRAGHAVDVFRIDSLEEVGA